MRGPGFNQIPAQKLATLRAPVTCTDPNSSYGTYDPTCVHTCGSLGSFSCTGQSAAGCICNPGYVYNTQTGLCILKSLCSTVPCTDPNSHYSTFDCSCVGTCANMAETLICTGQEAAGCICNIGYVIDTTTGTCVLASSCPAVTCSDPNSQIGTYDPTCIQSCVTTRDGGGSASCTGQSATGCICNAGYVIDTKTGLCILETNCPAITCGDPNSHYCEYDASCIGTCNNMLSTLTCTGQLETGCICDAGFVINPVTGLCIKGSKCPAIVCSDPNTYYDSYDPTCIKVCNVLRGSSMSIMCTGQSASGCICNSGYIFNTATGLCIVKSSCSSARTCSSPNTYYDTYDPSCIQTCDNLLTDLTCTGETAIGCVCTHSYVLDTTTGSCIPQSDCRERMEEISYTRGIEYSF